MSEMPHRRTLSYSTTDTTAQNSPRNMMPASPGNEAIKVIARDMQALVKRIQDLRHIGIEDNHIALPKICVIGDQSTGKSSLIEGMSEIKVPRSAGTCTRCPMEINLSESESGQPWTCQIYISRKYVYDGSKKLKIPKKSQPLGPWITQDQEDEHFLTLSDKTQVQEAIKYAQLAILNPGQSARDYNPVENVSISTQSQVKFSPNVVRLDISAADFPNLSFYDLPGVISQAELDEEKYLIQLIENLVKEYISQQNCIILLTLPMTDDATNSSAARIMRNVRGAHERTLGVLTKPDRIQTGESYSQWVDILEGYKFKLGHGYYVVRNNPDPTVEHSQAREEENDFFASAPWTSEELVPYQDRFGTRRLQTSLSSLLLEQIQGCLPGIIEQIDAKATRINEELDKLPDPPSENILYILCKLLHELGDRIRAHFDGGSSDYPLLKIWGHIAQDFKVSLVKTRPIVELISASERSSFQVQVDGDSDCEMTSAPRPVKRKSPSVPPDDQLPKSKPSGYSTNHFEHFVEPVRMFTWEEIREINEDSSHAGIPDQADPKAIEKLRQLSVQHWNGPMLVFLKATHNLVKEMLLKQLREVFCQYYQTTLYRDSKRIIEKYLGALQDQHTQYALENYDIECHKPFTMAATQLEQATKSTHNFLTTRRHFARAKSYLESHGKYAEGDPRWEAEIKKVTANELGPDRFLHEIKMMASTRGYYEVASSRFVDSTCQGIHSKLFSRCREELILIIEKELGISEKNGLSLERCQELMAPDLERQRRRKYLIKEKGKVTKAQRWLSTVKKEEEEESFTSSGIPTLGEIPQR
ncbi:P-loop containing nucleoside triphosphate hydrolase protein [Aspergillus coremiiformis]|uniref:P-loop containing nucleoside triphosphate hydrolase protein n=1 Tax=Aspergillus coremiiformis TaxID=138285 RepID=A0A5N6Z1W8_9EURO|nr:P-loop containing nucleoside triphosphate hydrolase protein [Aspergillus coremiiformis]